LLTGIGSPGRAQIDLFGTCYPDRLPIITRMQTADTCALSRRWGR